MLRAFSASDPQPAVGALAVLLAAAGLALDPTISAGAVKAQTPVNSLRPAIAAASRTATPPRSTAAATIRRGLSAAPVRDLVQFGARPGRIAVPAMTWRSNPRAPRSRRRPEVVDLEAGGLAARVIQRAVNSNAHMGLHNNWDLHAGFTLNGIGTTFCDRCTRGGPLLRQRGASIRGGA